MYASLSDLKTYLGISGTGDDALLTDILDRTTAAIDRYTGRVFAVTANSTRYFDAWRDVDGYTLRLDTDLAALTTVTNGDGVVVTVGQYWTLPRNGTPYYALELKGSAGVAWTYTTDPENAISVSGKWGYSLVPPDDVVDACVQWAAQKYRDKDSQTIAGMAAEQGTVTIGPGRPKAVTDLLRPFRRLT